MEVSLKTENRTAVSFSNSPPALEYYSAISKNENLPFAAMWIDLESIMLTEISHTA